MEKGKEIIWGYIIRKGRDPGLYGIQEPLFKWEIHPKWNLYIIQEGEPEEWGFRKLDKQAYQLFSAGILSFEANRNPDKDKCRNISTNRENPSNMESNNPSKINPSKVQSILFPRDKWTLSKARDWLKKHKFKYKGLYERTKHYYRFPQLPVEGFDRFRIQNFGESGIKAVIGFKGPEPNPENKDIFDNLEQKPYTVYMQLYEKYLKEAEELHKKEDLPQAGEKYYGAVAELVKMIGEKLNMPHKGHKLRNRIVFQLDKKYPHLNLRRLHHIAEILHINFYENDLEKEIFEENVQDVKLLISHLEKILQEI